MHDFRALIFIHFYKIFDWKTQFGFIVLTGDTCFLFVFKVIF